MEIKTDKTKLLSLIEKVQRGEIVLPQFQRNFVWSRDDIADLLLSIMKGYFIGSFLFLDADRDNNPFGIRTLAGIDVNENDLTNRLDLLVLDGQQRLTAINYAITAPNIPVKWAKYPYRFFLDLGKLLNGDDDKLIFSERADLCERYDIRDVQFREWILPFTELMKWEQWKESYQDWLYETDRNEYEIYKNERRDTWNNTIKTFVDFQVPTLEIPKIRDDDHDGIAEVCAIFEKLNSTGVTLSVYDLLTARLYKYGIYLHKLWEEAVNGHTLLKEFSGGESDSYGIFILRVIALFRGKEVKAKSLINLSYESFEADWKKAVKVIEKALKRISSTGSDGFGAFDPRWQPYSTMVPVLAVLLDIAERAPEAHKVYRDIKCWYWGSVFLERYAGSVDTLTFRDTMDMIERSKKPTYVPQIFTEIKRSILDNPGFTFKDVARVNSIYRGVMNLIAINGAKDFQNNDDISFHELEDHHIFPQAYLKREHNLKSDDVNTILNKTLISSTTNRRISRKSPRQYIEDIIPADYRNDILKSHLIGPEAQYAMVNNNYEEFLLIREKEILSFLIAYLEPANE